MKYFVEATSGCDQNSGESIFDPWRTLQASVDRLRPGDWLCVREGTYNEQVKLSQSGRADARYIIEPYRGERPVIDGENIPMAIWKDGIFEGRGVSYVDVLGLTAINTEQTGFKFDEDSHHFTLVGVKTKDTKNSGIWAESCYDFEIADSEIIGACLGVAQECLTVSRSSHFMVKNNEIGETRGNPKGGEAGIDFKDGCSFGTAYQNRVHHVPSIGIYFDAYGDYQHHLKAIENEVYHTKSTGIACATENSGLQEDILFRKNIVHHNDHAGIGVGGWGHLPEPRRMDRIEISHNIIFLNGRDHEQLGGGIFQSNPDAKNVSILDNVISQNVYFQIQLWKYGTGATEAKVDGNLIDGFRDHKGEVRGENYIQRDVVGSLMTLASLLRE